MTSQFGIEDVKRVFNKQQYEHISDLLGDLSAEVYCLLNNVSRITYDTHPNMRFIRGTQGERLLEEVVRSDKPFAETLVLTSSKTMYLYFRYIANEVWVKTENIDGRFKCNHNLPSLEGIYYWKLTFGPDLGKHFVPRSTRVNAMEVTPLEVEDRDHIGIVANTIKIPDAQSLNRELSDKLAAADVSWMSTNFLSKPWAYATAAAPYVASIAWPFVVNATYSGGTLAKIALICAGDFAQRGAIRVADFVKRSYYADEKDDGTIYNNEAYYDDQNKYHGTGFFDEKVKRKELIVEEPKAFAISPLHLGLAGAALCGVYYLTSKE